MIARAGVAMAVVASVGQVAAAHPQRRDVDLVIADDHRVVIVREPPPPVAIVSADATPPTPIHLGFRMTFGELPIAGLKVMAWGLALDATRPLGAGFTARASYEWLNLSDATPSSRAPELAGRAHRVELGLRHALLDTTLHGGRDMEAEGVRFYVEAEVAAGVAATSDTMTGTHVIPEGVAGLRFGYGFMHPGPAPTAMFEAAFEVRAVASHDGAGVMGGVGMLWE